MSDATSSILDRNLAALRRHDPALAQRIADASAAPLQWSVAKSGVATAVYPHAGRQLSLASRYDPAGEAQKLIAHVDHRQHAGIFVVGLALGYHVTALAQKLDPNALLVVFEPDLALCKAVLTQIDHSRWLGMPNVALFDDQVDKAAMVARAERYSAHMTQGTVLVTHPIVRQTHTHEAQRFGQLVTDTLAYCRTNVATALVNAARTVRNLTANLDHYAAGATINELHQAAAGLPAVCVSAGPSLARNIDLLRDPKWRSKVVLITVQTALKPLLDRGIRPDFVTALDYHAISRRFYEGIDALPDVTLVAEPKVHPSVLEAFPGPIRMTSNGFLERCLGPLAPDIQHIPHGATVAHLSVYLAQHLGCDPIILTGQDLGFSNGLYYCPGSAIHDVWANELSRFNTLEMMEWQRIMRHRQHLHLRPDITGRPIYSDEQMLTYHSQFERDFLNAPQTILNATEGGLPIKHSRTCTLIDALTQHATRDVPAIPRPAIGLDPARLRQAIALLRQRVQEIGRIRATCEQTVPLLKNILQHQRDEKAVGKLFADLERLQKRITDMDTTFSLINDINTLGAFKRNKADRAILHDDAADDFERQRRQLERDLHNLDWLIQACGEGTAIFQDALTGMEHRLDALKPALV